jgi:hypothetical protein
MPLNIRMPLADALERLSMSFRGEAASSRAMLEDAFLQDNPP